MQHHRPKVVAALGAAALTLALTACGSSGSNSGGNGPVTVTFWHEASDAQADAIKTLVNQFNAAHKGKITVKASFQGSYADAQTKYTAAVQSKSTPSIIAMNDISTGFMADSGQTVPVSKFIGGDSSFKLNEIPTVVQKYYSDDKGLLSMPFAVSQPLLYLNPVLIKKAGLNPSNPPKTFDEVAQWAQQVKAKTAQYGFSMNMTDSWILEELSAAGGVELCTPDNGRGTDPATGINLTDPTQTDFMNTLVTLFKNKVALNPGTDSSVMTSAFSSGKVGMILTSSGSYSSVKPTPNTPVTVAPFPHTSTSSDAGAVIGGASLWIDGPGHSDSEQQAAYEFAKYLESPAAQALWSKATGYLASNNAAKSQPDGKKALSDPNVAVMYKQLAATPASNAAAGCRSGALPTVRTTIIDAFNKAISGSDLSTELKSAQTRAAQQISQYNDAVK